MSVEAVGVDRILDRIVAHKRGEVERQKEEGLLGGEGVIPPTRDFKGAISRPGRINLIAEIKFASPSEGVILQEGDPVAIARLYETAGAGAVSVLTDGRFFHGDIRHIPRVREAISLPVLRKDFIVDPIQVEASMAVGADAILLIAGILTARRLKELLSLAREGGMACLTEVHSRDELNLAVDSGADIIGINNRNLATLTVDIKRSIELAPLIPEGVVCVSESGISSGDDVRRLRQVRVHAILVGTALMAGNHMMAMTRELADAGRDHDAG
jgi:indole-3-glycerol phosphate synthase